MSLLMTLIQQLILSSEGLVHGFCYNRMLEAKEGAPAPWIRMMGFWSVYIIEISVNWITGIRLPSFVNLSIAFGLTQVYMRLFYKDPFHVCFFAWLLLLAFQTIADLSFYAIYMLIERPATLNFMEDNMVPVLLCTLMAMFFFEWGAATLWQHRKGIRTTGFFILTAGLGGIGLYVLLLAAGVVFLDSQAVSRILLPLLYAAIGLWMALMLCALYVQKQHESRQHEWQTIQEVADRQKAWFEALEEQERRVSCIRHDQLNVLQTVQSLLEQEEQEEAGFLLESWQARLEERP